MVKSIVSKIELISFHKKIQIENGLQTVILYFDFVNFLKVGENS